MLTSRPTRLWVVLGLVMAGCSWSRPVADDLPDFRQGVIDAGQQTRQALDSANAFLRQQQVERALGLPTLTEASFVEPIPADDRARWDRAFAAIADYGSALERLLAPEQREGIEGELRGAGERLQSLTDDAVPTGVFGGLVRLGGLLVQIRAERSALAVMRSVDPAVQQVFATLAAAIGDDRPGAPPDGVRGTVWTSWQQVLARLDPQFRSAGSEADKRRLIALYIEALNARDRHDRALVALRVAYAALARAHAALAQGRVMTAGAVLRLMRAEYEAGRRDAGALDASGSGGER